MTKLIDHILTIKQESQAVNSSAAVRKMVD